MSSLKKGSLKEGDGASGTSGGYTCKSRKKKDEREKSNKLKYDQAIKQLIAENEERKRKAKYLQKKKTPQGEIWGDKLTIDSSWPVNSEQETLRFFGQNTNGISYTNGYLDWSMTLQQLHEYQADISGLVEVNLDLNN